MALNATQLASACDTVTNAINGADGSTLNAGHINSTPALITSLKNLVQAAHAYLASAGRASVVQPGIKDGSG